MIKEYFTDGLINLAILLSIFRTDLIGINHIISYPEVQDIFLGQSVAYMPTNFHNAFNSLHLTVNRKDIDLEHVLFRNIHNIPRWPHHRDLHHFDTFLVNAPEQNNIIEFIQADAPTTDQDPASSDEIVRSSSSPSLPHEGANSYVDLNNTATVNGTFEVVNNSSTNSSSPSFPPEGVISYVDLNNTVNGTLEVLNDSSRAIEAPILNYSICCNTFPGCNLSREDLDLIDILWRQDVDLGVGKEVFDQNLRLEIEKERELEIIKQNEKQRKERLIHEKEERQKQEHANRWLKENFMRDGETGEWVRLQNGTAVGSESSSSLSLPGSFNNSETDDWTLEAALEYISESVDPVVLNSLDNVPAAPTSHLAPVALASPQLPPMQYSVTAQYQDRQQLATEADIKVEHGESSMGPDMEGSLGGLVNYLNMTSDHSARPDLMAQSDTSGMLDIRLPSNLDSMVNEYDDSLNSSQYLVNNASLAAQDQDQASDYNLLIPVETSPPEPLLASPEVANPTMGFDLGNLTFFNNLTHMQADNVSSDLDLAAVTSMFSNLTEDSQALAVGIDLAEDMDHVQRTQDSFNESLGGATASHVELNLYDGLEGATGGADDFSDLPTGEASDASPFSKLSRLSESSNDSGFVYQGGFSSSSPPSSSPSSVTDSPASNNLTSSNDTELDPRGSQALVHHPHLAHNHTYHTLPGHVPRQVKKYAPKPPSRKGPHSRDQRRAIEMKIPFSVDLIINSPVEAFNELLTRHTLTEAQLTLVRDIRRRGKNKVAAQNCRKRKVGVIVTLADEMEELQQCRDRLLAERAQLQQEAGRMRDKFHQMYNQIFQSLRDEEGRPYDPLQYSLQQSTDGNVFLVPRAPRPPAQPAGGSTTSSDLTGSRKRKNFDL